MSVLVVPIDASQIAEGDRKQQRVKVAVQMGDKVTSQIVAVDAGKGEVKLEVDPKQPLSIAFGPENVSDEEIFHLQTLTVNVSPNQWAGKPALTLAPTILTGVWWGLWLRWCRTFVIEGRVVCADGRPVPGAEVRAFDVDFFWWWSSVAPVGPVATTDVNGHFSMKFRWCCGWWPWWWWKLRTWSLDPLLVQKILPIQKLNPNLKFTAPDPVPTVDIVNLVGGTTVSPKPVPLAPIPLSGPIKDPSAITFLRQRLVENLPHVRELENLRIWPWWPWTPWLDCSPDIIFRVTQNCGDGKNRVIVNENIFQARWDIPTNLNVTLVANDQACCIGHGTDPLGACAAFTSVCNVHVDNIGGNPGAPPTPVGYAGPGGGDHPYAGWVNLQGLLGDDPQTDYYEVEYSPHSAGAWNPVPGIALGGFSRYYFDLDHTGGDWIHGASFPVIASAGKNFYESRHHYEDSHPPPNWGGRRVWMADNIDLFATIQTANNFSDGAYDFRIKGYKSLAGGGPDPASGVVLNGCGVPPNDNNKVVIRLDNRVSGGIPPGTVHVDTTEPDCDITKVFFGGVVVKPCGSQKLDPNATFQIDFSATDSDPIGHLYRYQLRLKWGHGNDIDLLALGGTLTADGGADKGPTYASIPVAHRPAWKGGNMHLTFNHAGDVFKETCCYLIELTVSKRNIVDCSFNEAYYNQMHYTFTVIV